MPSVATDPDLDPTPAEAARSLLAACTTLELTTDGHGRFLAMGGYALDARGCLLMSVPGSSRLARHLEQVPEVTGRAEVVDAAPVAVRDRVRGRLRLSGWVSAVPAALSDQAWAAAGQSSELSVGSALLRLRPVEVELAQGDGAVGIAPQDWAAGTPDPMAVHEAEVLQHLAAGHPDQLAALVTLLPRRLRESACRVVPLRLHRRAIVLRVERAHDQHDVTLALPRGDHGLARTPEQVLCGLRRLLCGSAC